MRKFSFFLFALGMSACAGVMLPPVTPVQVDLARRQWPAMDLATLDNARTLYVLKCTACHGARLPSRYSMEKWPKIFEKMSRKAKLNKEEKEEIWRYIASAHDVPELPQESR